MRGLLWKIYEVAMGVALLIAAPFFLARKGGHYRQTLRGRLGLEADTTPRKPRLWLHAVSVGEVGVAATLARALPPSTALVITTVTPTGQAQANKAFASRASVAYLPFDLSVSIERFFRRHNPRALVLVEGDLWPLVLFKARNRGLPIAVVNGRVGDRGYFRLRRVKRLAPRWAAWLYGSVDQFAVQSPLDRDRLLEFGVPPDRIEVTGNLKFDAPEPTRPEIAPAIERLANGRPFLLAGSTMNGEEAEVLGAFLSAGGGDRALLGIAPRHPERWNDVEELLASRSVSYVRRSQLSPSEDPPRVDVLLLDSLGELAGLYAQAHGAFIGGTLVPTGGHNPLEPAVFGVPVVVGPSMYNFVEIAERFDRAGAWVRAADARELTAVFTRWLDDPTEARALGARGRALIEENRGAVARTVALLAPWIAAVR